MDSDQQELWLEHLRDQREKRECRKRRTQKRRKERQRVRHFLWLMAGLSIISTIFLICGARRNCQ